MRREPTDAQKRAGNYEKGHRIVHGMLVSVENEKGSVRKGYADGGRVWRVGMQNDYGYIRGTKGKDKDHIDVFLGPDPEGDHPVHIIDQNHKSGDFDEHKAMVGFPSDVHAVVAYHSNYEPGWDRFRGVTTVPMDRFKEWAYSGARGGKTKPAADYAAFKEKENVDKTGAPNPLDSGQDQRSGISPQGGDLRNEFAAGGSVSLSDLGDGQDRTGDKFGGDSPGVYNAGRDSSAADSPDGLPGQPAQAPTGFKPPSLSQPNRPLIASIFSAIDSAKRVGGDTLSGLVADPAEQVRQWTANRNNEAGANLDELGALYRTANGDVSMDRAQWSPRSAAAEGDMSGKMMGAAMGAVKLPGGNWAPGNVEKTLQDAHPVGLFNPNNSGYVPWLGKRLSKYVQNDLGTANDPLIALANQGISHLNAEQLQTLANALPPAARMTDALSRQLTGRAERTPWEAVSDYAVMQKTAAQVAKSKGMDQQQWLQQLAQTDPTSPVYKLRPSGIDDLGFDHVLHYLREATDAGTMLKDFGNVEGIRAKAAEYANIPLDEHGVIWRAVANSYNDSADLVARNLHIDPAKLPQMSLPDVIRKTSDWNKYLEQTQKIQDANLGIKSVLKEYPDTGLHWAELDPEALKGEGKAMGHCVGGYCSQVENGTSRILSLRDKEGQPHVTVELTRPNIHPFYANQDDAYRRRILSASGAIASPEYQATPWSIQQIKGKGNKMPVDQYIPAVQDLVRNMGPWGSVRELGNAKLVDTAAWGKFNGERYPEGTPPYMTQEEHIALKSRMGYAQGGRVIGGRLHLDDGGSAGDAPGDPGTGDPGAAGIGSGEMGTDAPAPSNGGDAGLATTLADMQASMSPNLSSNQNGMFSGTSPSSGSGVLGFLGNIAANVAAHAAGLPAGVVGMTSAAIHGSAPAAASTMGGVLGGIIGSGLGPVGSVVGSVAGNAIGNAVGNMPGVPASSVAADPSGHSASPSASASAAPSAAALAQLTGSTPLDPMGTRRLLADSNGFRGSPAVYGNWGSGLQSGWGFCSGGSVPSSPNGPLTRVLRNG